MEIRKYIPASILFAIRLALHKIGRYGRIYYSQEGEDFVMARILGFENSGFYVDVGAHHPSRFSNTYYFYKRGWRGINIDAWPGSMRLFRATRPRDINLELAVSDKKETIEFHIFKEPLLNSASKVLAEKRRAILKEERSPSNVFQVDADTLSSILERNLPPNTPIDFMSVDVEGLDLNVLQSNDWNRFRPKYVLVEVLGQTVTSLPNTATCKFMESIGYEAMSKLMHTVVFRDTNLGQIKYV